jgi:hypothetical protein
VTALVTLTGTIPTGLRKDPFGYASAGTLSRDGLAISSREPSVALLSKAFPRYGGPLRGRLGGITRTPMRSGLACGIGGGQVAAVGW